MSKITIITEPQGKAVAAVQGHALTSKYGDLEARVSFAKEHKLHKLEVPDDLERESQIQPFSSSGL